MAADPEKPGRPTADRYIPVIPLKPVQNRAPMPSECKSHAPLDMRQYITQGRLQWKEADGCLVCNNNLHVSYKDISLLYQFVTNTGQILGPHETGLCHLSHQMIASSIETARDLGLMAIDYKPLEYRKNGEFREPGIKDVGH